jgi:peptide/nickel transport system substrate-binding protein
MARRALRVAFGLSLIAIAGCASAPPGSGNGGAERPAPSRQNVLRVAGSVDVTVLHDRLKPGNDDPLDPFVNAGLAHHDDKDLARPVLLERLPSQDDGTWVVNPDGTMKTVLALRQGLKWQDGNPLTSADVVFAFQVYRDKDVPLFSDVPERYINSVSAVDDRTVEVSWKQLYVEAGSPQKGDLAPLPRHLLADLFDQDKKAFLGSSFWTTEQYVGAGPFSVTKRDPGVRVTLEANPYFVLGRPNIDAIEFSVVPDKNAIVVRLMAGEVDFAEYRSIQAQDAQSLAEQWKTSGAGQVYSGLQSNRVLWFQQRDVSGHQKGLLDVRVRQALMHAIDREALGREETAGLAGASDSPFPPTDALWPRVERAITKYPLDIRRTETLLNDVGWTKAADGLFRNAGGDNLDLEVTASSDHPKEPVIISDFLKRAGVNAKPIPTSEVLEGDPEYRASFPGVSVQSGTPGSYVRVWGTQAATAANGYRGQNRSGYANPQLDALIDRLNTTLDARTREDLLVDIEAFISADVALGHLYYQVRPAVAVSSLKGITGLAGSYAWNVSEWRFE